MTSKVYSAALEGIDVRPVEVEVDIAPGMPAWRIVGLGDRAVEEAKERINSALKNIGFPPPAASPERITVNLAPADLKKEGTAYDLPIAIGYLAASNQIAIRQNPKMLLVGELSLDGKLRPVPGLLAFADFAKSKAYQGLIFPAVQAEEASLIQGLPLFGFEDLEQAIKWLEGKTKPKAAARFTFDENRDEEAMDDFLWIHGQERAKRAITIAATGGHNLLLYGPPGTGKTLLARSVQSLLPRLESQELIDRVKIWSASGRFLEKHLFHHPPFRSPHHSASAVAIVGGGQDLRPGEVSLAHRGVLFLDEFPEFHRDVLEALREPLEEGCITIARARGTARFPAKFLLIAAMNPCPCGWRGDRERACRCSANEVIRYHKKISGPLLDRIDLWVEVPRGTYEEMNARENKSELKALVAGIEQARTMQRKRLFETGVAKNIFTNSEIPHRLFDELIRRDDAAKKLEREAVEKRRLSTRAYHRLLRVARTIADLEEEETVKAPHLAEALQYRERREEMI